jgi:hypothetical protein
MIVETRRAKEGARFLHLTGAQLKPPPQPSQESEPCWQPAVVAPAPELSQKEMSCDTTFKSQRTAPAPAPTPEQRQAAAWAAGTQRWLREFEARLEREPELPATITDEQARAMSKHWFGARKPGK